MNINKCSDDNYCYHAPSVNSGECNYPDNSNGCCKPIKPAPPVCYPDKIDCSCAGGMKDVLKAILAAIYNTNIPGFSVNVEITTTTGFIYTLPFTSGTATSTIITDTTITNGNTTISICDIAKIQILSGSLLNPAFNAALQVALRNITQTCVMPGCFDGNNSHEKYNHGNKCDKCIDGKDCAQGMQDYINNNITNIESIGYVGGMQTIESISAVTDINYTDVIGSVTLSLTTSPVLNSATLNTTPSSVVGTITPANTNVVSGVTLNNLDVVTDVTDVTATVSAPITATATPVVSNVTTNPAPNGVVTAVATTTANVVDAITTTTLNAVTSFGAPTTYAGALTGLDTISNITPVAASIPSLTSTNNGVLQVTIPIGAIDGTNPTAPVVLNVEVGGADITFGGNTTSYVLPNPSRVLGGNTATPAVTNITTLGTPAFSPIIETVTDTTTTVVETITPTFTQGSLVNVVTTGSVNSVATPTTIDVVQTVTPVTANVNAVGTVTTTPASSLFTTTAQTVVGAATLATTSTNAVTAATLATTDETVVQSINTSTISVLAPDIENIDGTITNAGDGIVSVNNTNGDISVYSTCDINSVVLSD